MSFGMQGRSSFRFVSIWLIAIAIWVLMAGSEVLGCHVMGISEFKVSTISTTGFGTERTVCPCGYYAWVKWSSAGPDNDEENWSNEKWILEIWQPGTPGGGGDGHPPSGTKIGYATPGHSAREATIHITNASALTIGTHTIRAWVKRDKTSYPHQWDYSSTCTVNVAGVDCVDEDMTTGCIDNPVHFTAYLDPSMAINCVDWEVRYRESPSDPWTAYATPEAPEYYVHWQWLDLTSEIAGQYQFQARNGSCDGWKQSDVVTIEGWEATPGISGAAIKREHDQDWFHITQSCMLRAKGHDYDSLCGVQQGTDYIWLDGTTWSGDVTFLSSTSGEEVTWEPTAPTNVSGHTIQATIKDDFILPDSSHTDDTIDVTTAAVTLKAYEAAADLVVNWANSTGSGNSTVTVHETDTPPSDSISKNMDDSESVSMDASTLANNTTGSNSSLFLAQEPFVRGEWTLKTEPSSAEVYTDGKVKVNMDAAVSGTLNCSVSDDDWDLSGCPVSVSVSATAGPISVSITPLLNTSGDTCEAQAAVSWGFSSDLLGTREGAYSEELEKSSGDGNGTFEQTFYYYPYDQDFVGDKGNSKAAVAKVGGKIKAKGWHVAVWEPDFGIWIHDYYDSSASMSCTDSSVTYYLSNPTIQTPKYYPADTGY